MASTSSDYTPLRGLHVDQGGQYGSDTTAAALPGAGLIGGRVNQFEKLASRNHQSCLATWWTQFQALTRKNVQVLKRQWKSTAYFLLGPLAFLLLVFIISSAVKSANEDTGRYDVQSLPALTKCQNIDIFKNVYERPDHPCVSIAYTPSTGIYEEVMTEVRAQLGWSTYDVQGFESTPVMLNWMYDHMGVADMIVNFNRTQNVLPVNPHRVTYEIWRNSSGSATRAASLQLLVDNIILKKLKAQQQQSEQSATTNGIFDDLMMETDDDRHREASLRQSQLAGQGINVDIQLIAPVLDGTQSVKWGTDDADPVVAIGLNIALVIAVVVAALLVVQTITTEKKDKLLGRMRIMGLSESAHWFTWLLVYTLIGFVVSLIIPAIGQATGFPVYTRCNYMVQVLIMFMFYFSAIAMGLCISSCVQQPRWVNVASIILFFVATFMSGFPIAEDQSDWYAYDNNLVQFLLWCMPWFHFNKSIGDVIRVTRSRMDSSATPVRIYPTFSWSDLTRSMNTADDGVSGSTVPSVSYALCMQLSNVVVFMTLAWYFSQLGGDLGASQRWYFPFSPTYWGFGKKKTREGLVEGDTLAREQIQSKEQRSVRTYKISKAFKDQSAVKEVSLQMERGECFVLLGHNGAGKTTMINMLTGLFPPTYGEAFVFGMDIRNDTAEIQRVMGICPQDNWLWPQLTSFEHLLLFAALRGLPRETWPQAIASKLAEFHLNDLINTPTEKLSGGMKRRLSLAMATLGAPEIIFLDEPTTGMDPVNKHKVWNAIANLKRDKVVVLTTHSMEEADFLGDKVAMMSGGRLRAMGTSLYLKNHFGAGYQIHLLSSPSTIPQLEQVVKDILPSAEIVGNAGGNLTVALPRKAVRLIPDFFRWIDQTKKSADGVLVKEWSISNSTLEEVFLRLCSSEKGINETTVDFAKQKADEDAKRMCMVCNEREAQMVTMYTKHGLEVKVPNVLCLKCCLGPDWVDDEKDVKAIEDGGMFGGDTDGTRRSITFTPSTEVTPSSSAPSPATAASTPLLLTDKTGGVPSGNGAINSSAPQSGRGGLQDAVGVRPPTVCQQVRAVFLKNVALSLTEKKTWIAKLIVLIIFAFAMASSGGSSDGGGASPCEGSGYRSKGPWYYCERDDWVNQWLNKRTPQMANMGVLVNNTAVAMEQQSFVEIPTWGALVNSKGQFAGRANHVWYSDATASGGTTPLTNYDLTGYGTGVMQRSDGTGFAAHASIAQDLVTSKSYVKQRVTDPPSGSYWCSSLGQQWFAAFSVAELTSLIYSLFADTYIVMERSNPAELDVRYKVMMWDRSPPSGSLISIFGMATNDTSFASGCDYVNPSTYAWDSLPVIINGMSNAIGRTVISNQTSIGVSYWSYPSAEWKAAMDEGSIAQALSSLSFITMLLWPTYMYRIIYEREENLFHMMRISGMKTSTYWLANYSFDMVMQIVWSVLFLLIPTAFGATVITRPGIAIHALILICFAHAMMGMTVFISALFTSRRAASVIGYLLVIITSTVSPVLSLNLKTWPTYSLIIPPVAYARALDLALRYGSDAFSAHKDMNASLLMLVGMGTVWLFIGLYLNTIKYRSKLYIFDSCRPAKRRSYVRAMEEARAAKDSYGTVASPSTVAIASSASYQNAILLDNDAKRNEDDDPNDEFVASAKEDVDVRAERKRILASAWGNNPPAIVIRNLVKSFTKSGTEKNDKLAVNHICLGIDQGECFGLLGPNGAGKTTTLSILSGLLDQTSGTVRVGAYDTRTEIDLVYTILGICPQFDTVWEDLSIREHFLFYARLKGADSTFEAALAQQQAEMVDLDGDAFNKNASTLSGGMKRRLSIGISLIGNPKVWLLDEPSTGLSPEARRQVWDIVSKQRKVGRTVIITTHSMEEADTLCSRIGIVAKGQLKCLGSQSHLKARFGDGFKLVFNLDHITTRRIDGAPLEIEADSKDVARDAELDSYVVNDLTCRGATLTNAVGKNMVYTLPKDGATTEDVLRIFNAMERKQKELKARFGVVEWGVQQSSLEEVFISVVDQADRDEDLANGGATGGSGIVRSGNAQLELAEAQRLTRVCC